jgi:hypothetical protein
LDPLDFTFAADNKDDGEGLETMECPMIGGEILVSKPSPSSLLSAAKVKSSGSKSRLPLGIDDYAQQLRNQIAA